MTGFVARENRARAQSYRKDEGLEEAVLSVNRVLAPHEPEVPARLAPLPHIFVFGLPRSGTTLAHQVLAWGLDVGYVTNVMARFWLAPHAGAIVSQAVLGGARDDSFISDYGKTFTPAGGHEFAYFWHRWLGINEIDDLLDFSGSSARADWDGAAAAVRRIQAAFGKPLLFKTNFAAQFLPAFARTFPMPLFLDVRRDPTQVALSILEARRRYYGDTQSWWATYPPDYEALAARSPAVQIAGQVAGLRAAYAAQIAKVPGDLTIPVTYDGLCDDPAAVVEAVRTRCQELYGTAPALLHPLPDRFERSPGRVPASELELAVAAAVQRLVPEGSA